LCDITDMHAWLQMHKLCIHSSCIADVMHCTCCKGKSNCKYQASMACYSIGHNSNLKTLKACNVGMSSSPIRWYKFYLDRSHQGARCALSALPLLPCQTQLSLAVASWLTLTVSRAVMYRCSADTDVPRTDVAVYKYDGHAVVVNMARCATSGLQEQNPSVCRIAHSAVQSKTCRRSFTSSVVFHISRVFSAWLYKSSNDAWQHNTAWN